MKKNLAVWTLFGLAFVVNPAVLACSSNDDEEDFTYGEADMKAAALGDWQGTAEVDGESVAFTLSLEQASGKSSTQSISAPGVTPQCGSRSFVKPAAACISTSSMPVVGTLTSDNDELSGPVTGQLTAFRTLESSELEVVLEDGRALSGSLRDQVISEGRIFLPGRGELGTFTLARP